MVRPIKIKINKKKIIVNIGNGSDQSDTNPLPDKKAISADITNLKADFSILKEFDLLRAYHITN